MEMATLEMRDVHSIVVTAYLLGLFFFMLSIIGWSWSYFFVQGNEEMGEAIGITLCVLVVGIGVTARLLRGMFVAFYHGDQLSFWPFTIATAQEKARRLAASGAPAWDGCFGKHLSLNYHHQCALARNWSNCASSTYRLQTKQAN